MDIGTTIKTFRVKQGVSQKDLALQTGISANALCSIE
jgi:transcriptional regulator with XRE-family HTH domain